MTFDWRVTTKPSSSNTPNQSNLNRNVAIGTAIGITAAALVLTKGKLKTLPKMNYGIKEVMLLCSGSSIGGYVGANLTSKKDIKGRTIELKNQLIYNDLIPLTLLKLTDMFLQTKNKLWRSIVLAGSLLAATVFGHKIGEHQLKKEGLKTNYPVKACHLLADFDDFLLPVAIATKSQGLQQFLKIISPLTFAPLGLNVGKTKDSKYFYSSGSGSEGSSPFSKDSINSSGNSSASFSLLI